MKQITGHIVDVVSKRIFDGAITIEGERITNITVESDVDDQYILPGFIDSHIHIESSMMLPSEFARMVIPSGTVACVSDPHEIANVCGVEGVEYMIGNGKKSPLKFFFGAPSCVPATSFETSGFVINATEIEKLLINEDIHYLGEMMNFPGVLYRDKEVLGKLAAARKAGKPIDGHAPELSGELLKTYAATGISTDHECMTLTEALEKIGQGMKVIIREGSAAKNFDDLISLVAEHSENVMFCSDDKHPDDILKNGHMDNLARRAVNKGFNLFDILRPLTYNPVKHYNLNVGLLQKGDNADFIIVEDLNNFKVNATYINGVMVASNGSVCYERYTPDKIINNFKALPIEEKQLFVPAVGEKLKVILAEDGQLYTRSTTVKPKVVDGNVVSDIENDILKIVVYNRYIDAKPAIGFIKNFGLKKGALVSTVAHDSHNIVAVGTSDREIALAINRVIESKGGIIASCGEEFSIMPLPVAGLMSDLEGIKVAEMYQTTDNFAKQLGTKLSAPFMTLAFMSLICIPELKLGDKGLFEILKLSFTDLME